MSTITPHAPAPTGDDPHGNTLSIIRQALDRLKFGAVHLTVHEGRLVQIEVTEKTRLTG
ncbi:MAG: YezD family protein [Alphaproteobacteria bacterium]|nr:YezD family protein [Alphaproteobacteria bacterium]MBU0792519.1 YezD family protein [Alphaproteobacteria bacterium]MBU0877355.1 YezD family protein [Alphaproteobacteria bacterium]MBU1770650.1 YezD family protein [Alphaproteobacteria bacterium]